MTDTLWFVEERTFDGRWAAVTYRGARPAERGCEGARKRFRCPPIEVNRGHHHLSLSALHAVYSPDGRFRATQGRNP